ncbi:hypothetical protein HPG69_008112, partial [Diceros bicornis minor]
LDPSEQLTSCEKLNITHTLSAGIYFCSHKAFLLPTEQAVLLRTLCLPLHSLLFRVQSETSRTEIETVTDLPRGRSGPRAGPAGVERRLPGEPTACPRPEPRRPGALDHASPKQPVAVAARRSATAQRPPGPSEVRTAARAARPRPLLRVRAPAPERARGAGGRRAVPRPSAAAAPSGRRGGRPSRRPRFFTCREFSRARARSIARFAPSRARFLSFFPSFRSPARALFPLPPPALAARALLPAGFCGAGRPAALPAPLHPRSGGGGGGGGAPRSDSFQYGTGSGRMRPRPPPSALLPAARAPHAARVAPPGRASPSPPARLPARLRPRGMLGARGLRCWRSSAASRPRPSFPPAHNLARTPVRPWRRASGGAPRLRRRCGPARTGQSGKRAPRDPAPTLSLLRPTRKGPRRLTSGCGRSPGNLVSSAGRSWRPGRGEALCCRPHVIASRKMALAEERTEGRPDPRWARVAAGEGCVRPPGPRRGSGVPFETWKGTEMPPV